jgi:hypothetical protein
MDILGYLGGSIVLTAILAGFLLQEEDVTAPGRALHQKFMELGTLQGKRKDEIIAKVGPPCSFAAVGGGKTLLQWEAAGFNIGLLFNGESCEGVTHQSLLQE